MGKHLTLPSPQSGEGAPRAAVLKSKVNYEETAGEYLLLAGD